MITLIYLGEKYTIETNGVMGPFCNVEDGTNVRWDQVQPAFAAALAQGVQLIVRTATAEEIAHVEAENAINLAKATASLHFSEQRH